MSKLTTSQRKELKDACKETLIRKLSQKEAHTYVNSKLGFDISFDYVQSLRSEIGRSAKLELLTLQKDHYALIQSIFFDRKDELQEMQKVLWHIVDTNKTNADVQIKAVDKLSELTTILTELYHSLPHKVDFGTRRHFYIHDIGVFNPKQQDEYDRMLEAQSAAEYEREFAALRKKNPELTDQEIEDKLLFEEEELEEEIRKQEGSKKK